jgi:hypothetical protein
MGRDEVWRGVDWAKKDRLDEKTAWQVRSGWILCGQYGTGNFWKGTAGGMRLGRHRLTRLDGQWIGAMRLEMAWQVRVGRFEKARIGQDGQDRKGRQVRLVRDRRNEARLEMVRLEAKRHGRRDRQGRPGW